MSNRFRRFLASDHILAMPLYSTLLPIAIPTVYLWILDSVALQRGTWVINDRQYRISPHPLA